MSEREPVGLLARLRQIGGRFLGLGSGDTIVGVVGPGASRIAIGKGIIQIDTLVVPLVPVLAGLIFIIAVSIVGYWYLTVPTRMAGAFNIAVADFSEANQSTDVIASDVGNQLSNFVFANLSDDLKTLPFALQPVWVWHDSLGITRKRSLIGFIHGRTPAERRGNACRRASDIGADVIIYGNLNNIPTVTTLVPEFCIRVPQGDTGELNQIVGGSYSLGSPILVDRSLDLRSKASVNGVLEARIKAMSWLTVGVTNDLNGDPRAALDAFQRALAVFDSVGLTSAPESGDGKEVFFYFIGREDLFLKRLEDGMQAFRQALTSNPNHARSHLGLGGIYYTRAQGTAPADRLQSADLENAIAEYNFAVAGARQAEDTPAEYQAHIAMGSALRLKGEAYYFRGDYANADALLDQAISEAKAGQGMIAANQYRVLAYAEMVLGNASYQKAAIRQVQGDKVASHTWYLQAHDAYQQCIKTADRDPQDLILATQIKKASCEPYDQAVLKALAVP